MPAGLTVMKSSAGTEAVRAWFEWFQEISQPYQARVKKEECFVVSILLFVSRLRVKFLSVHVA